MNDIREKILIIRLSSIGDILLATPFLRQVRNRFPNAQIDFVIKQKYSSLLSANPHPDRILQLENGKLERLINTLKHEKYTHIFDLHANFRSLIIRKRLSSKVCHRIKKNKLKQQLLVKCKIYKYQKVIQIPERYLDVGRAEGIMDDHLGLEFYWDRHSEAKINTYLSSIPPEDKNMLIAIAPGAGFFTKRWPIDYFLKLIEHIRNQYKGYFIILGDQYDQELGQILATGRSYVMDLTGKLDLMEAGALLSNCHLAISNDSGMMHMATAVKTPVLAIFGSSVEVFGFFPYHARSCVVENTGLNCRPCSHIGRTNCPHDHFRCMRDLTPDNVFNKVEQFLRELK